MTFSDVLITEMPKKTPLSFLILILSGGFRRFNVQHYHQSRSAESLNIMVVRPSRYRVIFLTGPPQFQYQKENCQSANHSCCSRKSCNVFFLVLKFGGVKKTTLYFEDKLKRRTCFLPSPVSAPQHT